MGVQNHNVNFLIVLKRFGKHGSVWWWYGVFKKQNMFLESETSQFKYLPNYNFCENLRLAHLLTCCSSMGESGGEGVESPLYFLFIRRPLSLSCLQNIPEMHALQTCFLAWWTGPHRPLHLVLMYHLSQHLSHSSHPGENLKIVEGLKRTLESEFDTSLVEKMFILRIISLQMVHTCELTKSPCFRKILAKEETRGSSGLGEMENKLWRNLNSLLASTIHFSRLAAHTRFSPPLAGVSLGVISLQKCGLGKAWLRSRTDRLGMGGDPAP